MTSKRLKLCKEVRAKRVPRSIQWQSWNRPVHICSPVRGNNYLGKNPELCAHLQSRCTFYLSISLAQFILYNILVAYKCLVAFECFVLYAFASNQWVLFSSKKYEILHCTISRNYIQLESAFYLKTTYLKTAKESRWLSRFDFHQPSLNTSLKVINN